MIQITAIVNQNPWWQDAKLIKEDEKVKKALNFNPSKLYVFENKNLLIIGPRQVGKTTFMKLCVLDLINKNIPPKNILYFSCDSLSKKEDLFELFEYFDGIADKGMAKYIFLDEITAIQDWNTSLLALFNSGYFTGNFVYVTSSSYLALKKELLPGRNIDKIIFYPLNFREYFELFYKKVSNKTINITNIKELFEEALRISTSINEFNKAFEEYINYGGGFLSAEYYFKTQNSDPINIFYEPYKDAFVSELVKAERSERIFKQIIFAVIKKYGSRYSLNSITKEVDIASNITVENNIELFEKLFIIRVIYARKDNKISYKSNKKIYIIDPFLYRVLKKYSSGIDSITEIEKAHIVEGIVGEELARHYNPVLFTYTNTGKEVDFIYNNIGIEIKYGNGDFNDLYADTGYILVKSSIIKTSGKKAIIPIPIFLYLISKTGFQKFF